MWFFLRQKIMQLHHQFSYNIYVTTIDANRFQIFFFVEEIKILN